MGQITKKVIFRAPIYKVWQIWTDVEKTPEWVDGVQESRITSLRREGRGLAWGEKCVISGQKMEVDHEMVEWESHRRTVIHTALPMGGKLIRTAEFREIPEGVEADLLLEYDLGMAAVFVREEQFQTIMETHLTLTANQWKERAEKGLG